MYSPQQIQAVIGSKHAGKIHDATLEHISIDSRKVNHGSNTLFFAIKSEKNDGHNFLEELYKKGTFNFVVTERREFEGSESCNFFLVPDVIEALQELTAHHRKEFNIPVVAITGSNGKTIVKEWLWHLLGNDYHAIRSPKSYNSQVGVPLSVWKMNAQHNLGIFEAGISKPGEMQKIENIIRPTIGVFTNIGPAHEKNFNSERDKIREKLKLFKNCDTVILPADDEKILVEWMKTGYKANLIGWSYRKKGNLNLRKTMEGGLMCQWRGTEFEIIPPFKDEASVENLITSVTIALQLGTDPKNLMERIPGLTQVGMRLEMLEGLNNTQLINDSYSADLSSLQIALDFLDQQTQHKNKTVILSDILEAGVSDDTLYSKVAALCANKGISKVIGIGAHISADRDKFPENSMFFATTEEFLQQLNPADHANESILIKGARVFSFERITKALQRKAHETVLEINLSAVAHNLSFLASLLSGKKIMAMVKAAAYGSGNLEIAKLMEYQRVDYLGVAYTNEGIELRKAGIQTPIMVMNPDPDHFDLLIQYQLEPELFSFQGVQSMISAVERSGNEQPFPVHIKVDTGMHRLGFNPSEIDVLGEILNKQSKLRVASVFSHLSSADDPQFDPFSTHQIKTFTEITAKLESLIGKGFLKHIANTAGAIRFREAAFDMVRLGIGLYGISNVQETDDKLIPTGRLKTHISQIRDITEGETVGYSRRHKAAKNERIATVPVGYADGLPRKLGNGRYSLLVNEQLAPIVGNVCMDMCMIDITGIDCQEGDEVIVFGPEHPIEDMATQLETIPYEVLTGISGRVKRVFYQE
ncbi:MAG: bifunctional UDP-N-acetylmuramoyl-tripeptide:D-alanyl-D-alanine ligase/alanine racemase [Bacteroidota bacterium]